MNLADFWLFDQRRAGQLAPAKTGPASAQWATAPHPDTNEYWTYWTSDLTVWPPPAEVYITRDGWLFNKGWFLAAPDGRFVEVRPTSFRVVRGPVMAPPLSEVGEPIASLIVPNEEYETELWGEMWTTVSRTDPTKYKFAEYFHQQIWLPPKPVTNLVWSDDAESTKLAITHRHFWDESRTPSVEMAWTDHLLALGSGPGWKLVGDPTALGPAWKKVNEANTTVQYLRAAWAWGE